MITVGPFHVASEPSHVDYIGNDPQKMHRLRQLAPYFDDARLRTLVPFLDESDVSLSLRDIDHLLTHMAPKLAISWKYGDSIVALHSTYRTWLDTWKRRLFDCFRRYQRVYFRLDDHLYATTPAQLNFFTFCCQTNLLTFARANAPHIHAHRGEWKRDHRKHAALPGRDPRGGDGGDRRPRGSCAPCGPRDPHARSVATVVGAAGAAGRAVGAPIVSAAPRPAMQMHSGACVVQF